MNLPVGARLRLARGEVVPFGDIERGGLRRRIIAGVVHDRDARARLDRLFIGHVGGGDQIAATQFGAVELELRGNEIHHAFHGEGRLRIARAAHRGDRRLVGQHDVNVHGEGRHHIGTGDGGRRIVRQVDVLQRVGALIVNERAAQALDRSLGVGRDRKPPDLVALLHRIGEVLAPILDPFDRATQQLGGGGDRNIFGIDA